MKVSRVFWNHLSCTNVANLGSTSVASSTRVRKLDIVAIRQRYPILSAYVRDAVAWALSNPTATQQNQRSPVDNDGTGGSACNLQMS